MSIRWLDAATIHRVLDMPGCIEVIEGAMRALSRGAAQIPLRVVLPVRPGLLFGCMPGVLSEPAVFGAKVLAVHTGADAQPSHRGVVVLFDARSGEPVALLDAGELTALRTAAASAVATRALADQAANTLAVLGTGEQARRHLEALVCVRPLREVRLWGRSPARAAALAAEYSHRLGLPVTAVNEAREAVRGADLICTVTSSLTPVLEGAWLEPGVHVNLVGASTAAAREADDEVVRCARFFVDHRAAALAQAGELQHAVASGAVTLDCIVGEIGEVLEGKIAGRTHASEITVYKSLGLAVQDLAAGDEAHRRALALGIGAPVK
jgi:ornithine cyclodeaminase